MDKENLNKYVGALGTRDTASPSKDEAMVVYLTEETSEKYKEIKKIMEWSNNTLLNSALTLYFKKGSDNNINHKKSNKLKKISFIASFKNEQRIKQVSKKNSKDDVKKNIVNKSIELLHEKLIYGHVNE